MTMPLPRRISAVHARVLATLALGLALSLPAGAQAQCSPSSLSTAQQSYDTASQFGQANQWAEAIPSLEEAIKACPEHWDSVGLMAYAKMRTQSYVEAQDWYFKLVQGQYDGVLAKVDNNVLQAFGFVLLKNRNWPDAERVYEAVLGQDPANKEAHERLVYSYSNSDDLPNAIEHLEALYALTTGDEQKEKASRIGTAYQKLGDNETAKQWFEMSGGATSGMFAIAVEHMSKKEWPQAADAFQKYLQGKADSAPAWKNLGVCYDKMGKKSDAMAAYTKVLELDPARYDVAVSLGFVYSDLERWADAARLAEPAVRNWDEENPHKDAMYFLMGKILEKRDSNYEQAIGMFEKAKDDPHWGDLATREIVRQRQLIEIRTLQQQNGR
jgi:tetratricopeptide (TPR) repeat protein